MDIKIDETKNIAHIKLTGQPSSIEILDAFDATVSHEDYKRVTDLWNFKLDNNIDIPYVFAKNAANPCEGGKAVTN